MAYKEQFWNNYNTLYLLACKTLFGPIKPTNLSIRMADKGQISFGKPDVFMNNKTIIQKIKNK